MVGGARDSAYVGWVKNKRHTELLRGSGAAPDRTWTSQRRGGGEEAWKQRVDKESGQRTWQSSAPAADADDDAGMAGGLATGEASIRALVDRLAPGWQAAQNVAAAYELAELAKERRARRRVVKAGAVPQLIALLARQNDSLLEPTCACLSVLAQDDEGRRLVISAGAARPLVQALRSSRSAVLREATGTLWNMTHKNDAGVQAICAARAVPALVQQLRSADEHVLINVLSTLANIATTASGRTSVGGANVGAVSAATDVLRTGGAGSRKAAAKLLAHLTHGPKSSANTAVAQINKAGGVPALVQMLGGDDESGRDEAVACLGNLSKDVKLKSSIVQAFGTPSGGNALAVASKSRGGGGSVRKAANAPRSRTSVEASPNWHPRTAPSRRQRLGLDPPPRQGGGTRSGPRLQPKSRGGGARDFQLSENVQAAGAWKEQITKEEMPVPELLSCVARCRVGERHASRQPRPWSHYMADTSGSWGHVTATADKNDTM
jgi:hypothetical protein